jgi:hypothetical protein
LPDAKQLTTVFGKIEELLDEYALTGKNSVPPSKRETSLEIETR